MQPWKCTSRDPAIGMKIRLAGALLSWLALGGVRGAMRGFVAGATFVGMSNIRKQVDLIEQGGGCTVRDGMTCCPTSGDQQ